MSDFKKFINFLNRLEDNNIYYRLNRIRNESILVEVVVPGQRWEVEFMEDGTIEIEKFISEGGYYNEKELENLFSKFSD